ncbi:MAG: ABC transporter ATP-binding protein [Chloroflexi bacterium]|nr:ABC transporter ATP-binding protein [Chloroflexota bacterium]
MRAAAAAPESGPAAPGGHGNVAAGLRGVTMRYPSQAEPALRHVTLEVAEGEFVCLLGPSGSGKTTALRLIAGHEQPQSGTVVLGGCSANGVPAHRRNVGMVYQSHALFPHLTVAHNVAFGLRMRGVARAAQYERVAWALDLVRLGQAGERYPDELSGGQQQRVALARALAIEPSVLLLDEPFANLDRHLRDDMRLELKALQRRLGITTIFVTHDQEEALALADRIAILSGGRLEQTGPPELVYHRPQNAFVARFLGEMNLLPAALGQPVPGSGEDLRLALVARVPLAVRPPSGARRGDIVAVCLRGEHLRLAPLSEVSLGAGEGGARHWSGTIELATYRGAATHYAVTLEGGHTVRVVEPAAAPARWRVGDRVAVVWIAGVAHSVWPNGDTPRDVIVAGRQRSTAGEAGAGGAA